MIKFLHTRIRVAKPEASIAFYQKLGFELGEQKTSPQGNQLAFLHLPGNDHFLELTYSPDFEVKFPEDLMHTAVGVADIIEYCGQLEQDGIEIWPEQCVKNSPQAAARWPSSPIPTATRWKFWKDRFPQSC